MNDRRATQRALVGTIAVAVAAIVLGGAPVGATEDAEGTPSHPGGVPDTCEEILDGPPGDLNKVSDPPDGSPVEPGQKVTIRLVWDDSLVDGDVLHKALDCVTVDGVLDVGRSVAERDADDDGTFEHTYTIPDDAPPGTVVCDRGFISGDDGDHFVRERSNEVCFTVKDEAPPPPAPQTTPPPPPMAPPPLPPPPQVQGKTETAPAPLDTTSQSEERARPRPQPTVLARTGDAPRLLVLLAGLVLTAGGAAFTVSPHRRRHPDR
ncbi:MAG: hypothetical protein ACRDY7_11960 [Acidimicrobiia bacterium]